MARPSGDHCRSTSLRSLKALRVSAPWRRISAAARRRSSPSASRVGRSGAKSSAAAADDRGHSEQGEPERQPRERARGVHGGGVQRQQREGAARGGVGRGHRGQPGPAASTATTASAKVPPRTAPARARARGRPAHAVADGEGRSGSPEHRGQSPADDRFLDVETLEEVQEAEDAEQRERDRQGPAATARELPRGAEEGKPGGQGQRMGQRHLVDGGDGQEGAQPRRHRGGQRRGDVDQPDEGGRAGGEQGDALIRRCGGQVRGPVQPGPPHGRVARGRVQIAPVLDHQPRSGREQRGDRDGAQSRQRQYAAGEQRGDPDMAFVQPPAEHEQPRAERVALDTDNARDGSGRHGRMVQAAPLARLCAGVGIVLASRPAVPATALGAGLP